KANGRKSLDRAKLSIAHLRDAFEFSRAIEITADRVSAYIQERQEQGAMAATIRNELAALKRMFTLAVQAGKVPHKPYVPSIEVRNTRTGFFEPDALERVLGLLREELRPIVEFGYLTGWRVGEILPLRWSQVDMEAGIVRLEPGTTKNDEGRVFPFRALPELEALLKRQKLRTEALERATNQIIPWLFHRRGGQPVLEFRQAWNTACTKAGVPGRLFHDLRRTAVRNLERATVPRSVAMKLTGHKTESIYRRYAIVSESDLTEGVRKLAAMHGLAAHETESQRAFAVGSSRLLADFEERTERHTLRLVANRKNIIAGGGTRTPTGCKPYRILSPARLPVSPLRRVGEI